ncbi:hypothetical protein H4R33_005593 [Dimargaris cristalligena]|nr:hypothetical protein H4R33_005593 [Dimargaris cristalligena]
MSTDYPDDVRINQHRHHYPPSPANTAPEVLFNLDDDLLDNHQTTTSVRPARDSVTRTDRPGSRVDHFAGQAGTPSTGGPSNRLRQRRAAPAEPAEGKGFLANLTTGQSLLPRGSDLAKQWEEETTALKKGISEALMPYVRAVAPLQHEAINTLRAQGSSWSEFLNGPRQNYVNIRPAGEVSGHRSSVTARDRPTAAKLEPALTDPLSPGLLPQQANRTLGGGSAASFGPTAARIASLGNSLRDMLSSSLMLDESSTEHTAPMNRKPSSGIGTSAPVSPVPCGSPVTRMTGSGDGLRQRRGASPVRRSLDTERPRRSGPGTVRVIVHQVCPTDTLAGICLKYGIQPAALKRANKLWATDTIHFRDQLLIPIHLCESREVHLYNTVMMNAESPFYQPNPKAFTPSNRSTPRPSLDSEAARPSGADLQSDLDRPSPAILPWVCSPGSPALLALDSEPAAASHRQLPHRPSDESLIPDIRAVPADSLKYFSATQPTTPHSK